MNSPFSKTFCFLLRKSRGLLRALVCQTLWTSAGAASRGRLCPAVRAGGTGHTRLLEETYPCTTAALVLLVRPALGSENNHMNPTNSSICLSRLLPAAGPGLSLTLQGTIYRGAVRLNVLAESCGHVFFGFCLSSLSWVCVDKCCGC